MNINRKIFLSLRPGYTGLIGALYYNVKPHYLFRKEILLPPGANKAVPEINVACNNLIYNEVNLFLMVILYIFKECTIR
jgi:hypothetical protein